MTKPHAPREETRKLSRRDYLIVALLSATLAGGYAFWNSRSAEINAALQ